MVITVPDSLNWTWYITTPHSLTNLCAICEFLQKCLPCLIIRKYCAFRMFSLRDLRSVLCSLNLNVLRAQRIICFFILITHKSTRSENWITWLERVSHIWALNRDLYMLYRMPRHASLTPSVVNQAHKQTVVSFYWTAWVAYRWCNRKIIMLKIWVTEVWRELFLRIPTDCLPG